MTEAEALDMAARAVGCCDWGRAQDCCFNDELNAIRAHAATIMENAENARLLSMSAEREINLRGELLRLQRKNAALKAENERLREALEEIADRPGKSVEYIPGYGDEVISEARHMELIAIAALKEIDNGDR